MYIVAVNTGANTPPGVYVRFFTHNKSHTCCGAEEAALSANAGYYAFICSATFVRGQTLTLLTALPGLITHNSLCFPEAS